MANLDLIGLFLEHLRVEQGLSDLTASAYSGDLRQWEAYMRRVGHGEFAPMQYTTADLREWVAYLAADCHVKPRTLHRKRSALMAFYRYLMRVHGLQVNPAKDLQGVRADKPLPVFIRTTEINELLDKPQSPDDFIAVRNHLILLMLYTTGLRSTELLTLKNANVDTRSRELKVRGKRNKDRLVPFGAELAEAIDHYREVRRYHVDESAAELFVMPSGLPMYRSALYKVVHQALAEAGVHAARLSPHVLRHTFATDMLNSGADLNAVSHLMGHQSLASTQVYTHITYRDLQRNYQSAHPRAQQKKGENHGSQD